MSKSIWYITKYFSPETKGSTGSRGWQILKAFAEKGYTPVAVISDSNNLMDMPVLEKKIQYQEIYGVKIVWLKTLKYSIAKSLKRILSWIHFEWNIFCLNDKSLPTPDVIIVSSLSLLTILNGVRLKKKYGCKLVFEIRDIWPLTIVEEGGISQFNPFVILLSILERYGYKKADLIVGTMPNLGEHVKNILGYAKQVETIPMGITDEMLNTDKQLTDDYLDKYLDKSSFNIVHAGTVGITNALTTFFKAAELLKDKQDIRFVIVGDGALKNTYQNEYGHLPNIVFAPKVKKNQVYTVLSNANIVYFSTYNSKVWDYGQSLNKVIDYMLSGKPVLASYSGYPSMINDAGCGFFVPSENTEMLVEKIEELYNMTELERKNIGEKGRPWLIKNHSYSFLADRYLSLIFDNNS